MWRSSTIVNISIILAIISICHSSEGKHRSLCPPDSNKGQKQVVVEYLASDMDSSRMEKVRREYCSKMTLPKGFEKQFLQALEHYPELKNVRIKCVQRKRYVPLTTMPAFLSTLVHKRENRRYRIIISSDSRPILDSLILKSLPYNAQIGVLGHELAHVSFFTKQKFGGVMRVARGNLSKKYLDKMEFETDQSTVDHGLGWQLLKWSEYSHEVLSEKYFKDIPDWRKIDLEKLDPPLSERYMHPWTIKKKIKENPIYRGTWEGIF